MKNAIRMLFIGAGGAFAVSATAANLIENPEFATLDGWTASAGDGTATLDNETGSPDAPSLHLVATTATPNMSMESTCMPVDDSNNFDVYMDANAASGFAMMTVNTYSDDDCTDGLDAIASESFPVTGTWETYSMSDEMLPDGARSAKVVLTASTGASATAADVHFDHIAFGPSGTTQQSINVNQEGLSGTWYNPATGGQGMQFSFSPDDSNPGEGTFFGAWYTYDVATSAESSQRWYSMQAVLSGDADNLPVTIYQNT
ncbi:MAG TPA: hypothetical protein VJ724_00450, partial [Tahibacter sp.]|nr:hypothetical protein [Tahibacter sp.]